MSNPPALHPPRSRRGMTLVEAVCSVAVVGVMMAAALETVGASARNRKVLVERSRGPALAQQLLAEANQAWYAEPDTEVLFGPEPGETDTGTRSGFDDVDDYHGFSESPPRARDGTALAGYSGWSRSVQVQHVTPSTLVASASDTGLKRITVTVRDPEGKTHRLRALRSKYSRYEQTPDAETTYVTSATLSLQIGGRESAGVRGATNLMNQVP